MAITDVQKLSLYNGALEFLGETDLGSLTEERGPRRVLDGIWDRGAVRYCLEQGMWNFATRVAKLAYDPSIETTFGFTKAFQRPSDYVRTVAVSDDEYFRSLFTAYDDKQGWLYADIEEVYFAYVSDDAAYGTDYTLWPETFKAFVEAYMGMKGCKRITGAEPSDKMMREFRHLQSSARSKDALNQASKSIPVGTWARARRAGRTRDTGEYA